MHQPKRASSRGITVVEVLIALGMLVVMLAFASPSLSKGSAKADLKAAVQNVELSVDMARNTARVMNTTVVMHFEPGQRENPDVIRFSLPDATELAKSQPTLQEYQLPPSVRIKASDLVARFDYRGIAEYPVQVLLVSEMDDRLNQKLLVK